MQVIQEGTCVYGNNYLGRGRNAKDETSSQIKDRCNSDQKVNPPKTIKECRSFCGMVNYMSMFLPSLQEKLIPIYFITRKGIPFYWGEEQQKAFEDIKKDVTNVV